MEESVVESSIDMTNSKFVGFLSDGWWAVVDFFTLLNVFTLMG